MKHIFTLLIAALILQTATSQITKWSEAKISNVNFSMSSDKKLVITYDIVGGESTEKFDVVFFVIMENGKKLDAKTATGNLKNVSPGKTKKIYWDIGKDIVYLDETIYVEVEAEHINPKIIPYTSKAKAFFLSTLFPGIGSTRLSQNKAHIIKGLAGYACIGLAVKYNNDAVAAFENYKTGTDGTLRNNYITETENNLNMSNYLIYGAAAIWLIDYINILVMENKTDKNNRNISFTPTYNPISGETFLAFKWEF